MKVTAEMTLFFSEHDVFSNWYRSTFVIKGVTFNCVEQFMMYCKAKLFGDESTAAKILFEEHPRQHKALGREVTGYVDEVWSERRVAIVIQGLFAKFSQNSYLLTAILGTGDTVLVEASKYDKLWGVGLSENDPRALDPQQWIGQNLLGFALGVVRKKLREDLAAGRSDKWAAVA